jgi:hypothetical protein
MQSGKPMVPRSWLGVSGRVLADTKAAKPQGRG